MKRFFSALLRLLPHVTLILALMMLTFFVIDCFNEAMAFLNNTLTKRLLCVFSVCAIILSVAVIVSRENHNK